MKSDGIEEYGKGIVELLMNDDEFHKITGAWASKCLGGWKPTCDEDEFDKRYNLWWQLNLEASVQILEAAVNNLSVYKFEITEVMSDAYNAGS